MKAGLLLSVLLCSTVLADSNSVEELQREKVAVLKQIYDDSRAAYQSGELMFVDLCKAQSEYLEGTLELASTQQDRLRIHRQLIKVAEDSVAAYEKLVSTRDASRIDLLKAKVVLLERRIALTKEEQAGK